MIASCSCFCVEKALHSHKFQQMKAGSLCNTFISIKPNVRWKLISFLCFYYSEKVIVFIRKLGAELLLGALVVCERIKPLCLLRYFTPNPRFDSFVTYTDVVPTAKFSRVSSGLLQLSNRVFAKQYFFAKNIVHILLAGRCKLQYLMSWTCNYWYSIFYEHFEMYVYIKSFVMCSFSTVISVSCQPNRL